MHMFIDLIQFIDEKYVTDCTQHRKGTSMSHSSGKVWLIAPYRLGFYMGTDFFFQWEL